MGVELELQIVNLHDFDLSPGASALPGLVTPEITDSMIELCTGVCTSATRDRTRRWCCGAGAPLTALIRPFTGRKLRFTGLALFFGYALRPNGPTHIRSP
jgi:hypothetical protein